MHGALLELRTPRRVPIQMRTRRSLARSCSRAARALAAAAVLASPATGAYAGEPSTNPDPLEKVNRATHAFNDALDRMLARPAARAYRRVVPESARNAVSNAVANLDYPTTALNSALQGKFRDAGTDTLRFLVNSTLGVAGLMDPATRFGLPRNDEDFGQTLGRWGVPSGPYLVLPFLGPSNLRDAPARFPDRYTNARYYIGDGTTEYWLLGADVLDTRAALLSVDNALQQAYDPYAVVRDAYLQRREYLVRDGDVPEPSYEDEMLEEPIPVDAPSEGAPPAGTPPSATPPEDASSAAPSMDTLPSDAPSAGTPAAEEPPVEPTAPATPPPNAH